MHIVKWFSGFYSQNNGRYGSINNNSCRAEPMIRKFLVLPSLLLAVLSMSVQAAGTVEVAEITPTNTSVLTGTDQRFDFNALNTTGSILSSYTLKLSYSNGLNLSNLVVSPSPKIAKIDTNKKLIAVQWSKVGKGINMTVSWNANAGSGGGYTFTGDTLSYKIGRTSYSGTVNTATLVVAADTTPPAIPTGLSAMAGSAQVVLNWNTNTDPSLAGYKVYRALVTGGPYLQLTSSPLEGTTYTDSTASNGSSYFYVITAVDASGNASPYSSEVNATPQDTGPPAIPTGLSANLGDARVELSWNANGDSDLVGYNLYRAMITGGPYTQLNSSLLTNTSYLDTTVSNGTSYYYVIGAIDSSGNASAYSNEVSAIPQDTPPDAPSGLSVNASDSRLDLTWSANGETDLVGYHVYRSTVSAGPYTQLTSSPLAGISYTDTAVTNGTSYWYVIKAVDTSNQLSAYSNEVSATPLVITQPDATVEVAQITPSNAAVRTGANQTFYFNAQNTTGATLANYTVKLAYSNGLNIRNLTLSPSPKSAKIDTIKNLISIQWIKIANGINMSASWDTSTNINANYTLGGSSLSYKIGKNNYTGTVNTAALVVAADTTPPAAPTGLSAIASDAQVVLNWSANTDSDLAGYHVYRALDTGGSYTQLTTSALASTTYSDTTASNDNRYFYVITAVDNTNNVSAYSSEVSATPQDAGPPVVPAGLSASAGDARVELNWIANNEPDLAGYHVYRAQVSAGPYTLLTASLLTSNLYTDTTVTNGSNYFYVITAVDTSNKSSGYSNEVSAQPVDNIPPQISQIQITDLISDSATFSWRTDEPATSQVEYGLTSAYGQASTVDSLLTMTHSVMLSGLIPGSLYHYRILSNDDVGNTAASNNRTFIAGLNQRPTAVTGGPYDGTPGVVVLFDGSGSGDLEGDALTYHWDFGDGSTATGVNPSHSYSDKQYYTVTLTVNDGNQDSTPVTTTVEIHKPIVYLRGTITQNILTADYLYKVTGNVNVSTLTIEPGVEIRFPRATQDGSTMLTFHVGGTLTANGSEMLPIKFTSDSGSGCYKSDWDGIIPSLPTTNILLDNVIIECADNGVRFWNVQGQGIITNSLLRNNKQGILTSFYYNLIQPSTPTIDSNTFHGNTFGIVVYGRSNPTIINNIFKSSSSHLSLQGAPNYSANPNPIIRRNSFLTSAQYTIKSSNYTNGANTVIDLSENWWGTTNIGDIRNKISDISNNIYSNAPYLNFANFLDSEGGQPVTGNYLYEIIQDTVLDTNTTYTALGHLTVPEGVKLTVSEGTWIKFPDGRNSGWEWGWDGGSLWYLKVHGSLSVQGTPSNRARFSNDETWRAKSVWGGIRIFNTATNVSIDNAVIIDAATGVFFDNASGTVSNSNIQGNSIGISIRGPSANPTISGGNIIKSNTYGISVSGWGSGIEGVESNLIIQNNYIYDNSSYNLSAPKTYNVETIIDASNNWWGTTDTALIDASIYDINDAPTTTAATVNYLPIFTAGPPENSVTAPVLDTQPAIVGFNPHSISGTASAYSTVTLYVNEVFSMEITAAYDGSFSADLLLTEGSNAIYATVIAGLEESDASNIVTVILDTIPPLFNSNLVTVSEPFIGQVTLTGLAGATEGSAGLRLSNPLNGGKTNGVANADGSFSLAITATVGDSLILYAIDVVGNVSPVHVLNVPGTVPVVGISISSPLPTTNVTRPTVLVSGTFTAGLGIGITVNGVAAIINGNQFFANNVPLNIGSNTITATLSGTSGQSASDSVTLTYTEDTNQDSVILLATPETGLAPMDVTFSLELADGLTVNQIDLDADGDGTIDQTTYDLTTPLQFTYTEAGVYTAEVTITDDLGTTYTANKIMVVQNTVMLRNQVHAVYYTMLQQLRDNNIDGAVQNFTGSMQAKYREIFTLLQSDLASAVDEMGVLRASKISSNYAELTITRNEDGVDYAYFIYLIRSEDGVWRIDGM